MRLRASRLGLAQAPVEIAAETHVDDIVATLQAGPAPALVIIDSIQTMWTSAVEAAPGTVTQVRGSAQALIRYAKTTGACVILVGHVTKDGQIAGPRVVEHMVDAVIFFEGEGGHDFRILRGLKNRFGGHQRDRRLRDARRRAERGGEPLGPVPGKPRSRCGRNRRLRRHGGHAADPRRASGAGVPTGLGTARRAVVGWDNSRLAMVLAVLEAHGGVRLGQHDVYLNVAGGLKITEPAADLAVAAALVSSLTGNPLPVDMAIFGEVSLSGAIRPVSHATQRLKEAAKLGFGRAAAPVTKPGDEPEKVYRRAASPASRTSSRSSPQAVRSGPWKQLQVATIES